MAARSYSSVFPALDLERIARWLADLAAEANALGAPNSRS